MHTVPQIKDRFTIKDFFYYSEALIFTHPLVCKFLCGLIFMGHPVASCSVVVSVHDKMNVFRSRLKIHYLIFSGS